MSDYSHLGPVAPYWPALLRLTHDRILAMAWAGIPRGRFVLHLVSAGNNRPVMYSETDGAWMLETQPHLSSGYYPFARGTLSADVDRAAQFEATVREHMAAGWQETVVDKITALCGGESGETE